MYMSAASPEAGEFAARNHLGAGFAFTTVPIAKKAVTHYRACAAEAGWEPTDDHVIYRPLFHVADTDEQAFADMATLPPRMNLASQNKGISDAILKSVYYGSDVVGQRQRNARRELGERIELGQVLVGSPDTVFKQVKRIREELGAGVVDLVVGVQLGEKTMRSIELFGTKVLPRIKEL
jgi:alkanesulfonate monooxygenase SsuD/methylene tetrahydromethanopterin reductase-like flavin-dependent oxidoreductase (luciferase family)